MIRQDIRISVTHPFSPLKNHSYQLIEGKNNVWGEDRILCLDNNGFYRRILTEWTDYEPLPSFLEFSQGRAFLSDKSLLELAAFLESEAEKLST